MGDTLISRRISVTFGMRGYFAVMLGTFKSENGYVFEEPIDTSLLSYKTFEEATRYAYDWAKAEGITKE